jgi:broad specificity phosphatase PhoE
MFSLSILFISMFAVAQETDFKKEKKRIKQEQKEIRNLNLNDNQGQQVKDINSRYKDEHKAISKNDALTQQQKQEQIQALNKRRVDEIHNLIGQDKAKDWAGMKKNDKNKMKDKAKDKEDKVKDKQREKKVKEEKGKKEKKEKKNGKG